jgi:hypothetical protein
VATATRTRRRYEVPVTKYRRLVFAAKVSSVALVAVGIEFFITQQFLFAAILIVMGVVMSLWPVKIDVAPDPPGTEAKAKSNSGGAIHPLEEL